MKLSPQEMILLPLINSERVVAKNKFNIQQQEVVESLLEKRLVKISDEDDISLSKEGMTLLKVYQSGVSYDVLLNNMSNNHLIKLISKIFDKCYQKDIHIRVVLERMEKEQFSAFMDEVVKAVDNRAEDGENVEDVAQPQTATV